MKNINYNSVKVEGIDMNDYPDFTDAFITFAEYENGTELTENEMDKLSDKGLAQELIHENQLYL